MRSRSGNGSGQIMTTLVAPLGALLMLYGMLIVSFLWAQSFYDCTNFGGASPWFHLACKSTGLWRTWILLLAAEVVTGFLVNVNLIVKAFLPDEPIRAGNSYEFQRSRRWPIRNRYRTSIGSVSDRAVPRPEHERHSRRFERPAAAHTRRRQLRPLAAAVWKQCNRVVRHEGISSPAISRSRRPLRSLAPAANPYAGGRVFRNRPVAVLMPLADVRLDYWMRHPNCKGTGAARRNHFSTAWRELSGKLQRVGRCFTSRTAVTSTTSGFMR
jgi:hypothetical protein